MPRGRTATVVSLLLLAATLVFGVTLAFVLAFNADADADHTAAEPRQASLEDDWAKLGVEEVEFVFLGDLTPDEQASIRREMKAAQVLFAEHFGAVTSDFTAYISTDLALLNERILEDAGTTGLWFACGGIAYAGAIAIVLEGCLPEARALGGPLAHEYFHILQRNTNDEIVGTANPGAFPPDLRHQLVEGSATYAAALYDESQGRRSMAVRLQGARLAWSGLGPHPSAYDLGERDQYLYFYEGGLLLADWLIQRAGPESILAFFRTGAHRAAFQEAFGLSASRAARELSAHLFEVAPPFQWRVEGVLLDANEAPIVNAVIGMRVQVAGEFFALGATRTGPDGAFAMPSPGSDYALAVLFQCPETDTGPGGFVVLGEQGKDSFVPDDDGLLDDSDERVAPFDGEATDRTDLTIRIPATTAALTERHCH